MSDGDDVELEPWTEDDAARMAWAIGWWREFWFQKASAYPLGLVRMTFGALVIAWAFALLPDLYQFFGQRGVNAHLSLKPYQWNVLGLWNSDLAVFITWLVLFASALALTVGWHSRLAAVLVFVLIYSFEVRNTFVFNSGDLVIRLLAFYLALSSCGAALSLDQRLRTGSFWSAQSRAVWPLRLMQIQMSIIYLATVQAKMAGTAWPGGTAVSYSLRLEDLQLMPTPHWVTANALLMNIATWSTLAIELALGLLVWNRRLRPWVLGAGVVMHLVIMVTIAVGFFSLAMYVLYLSFLSPDTVRRLPEMPRRMEDKLRSLLSRRKMTDSQPDRSTETVERHERILTESPGPPLISGDVQCLNGNGQHAEHVDRKVP